jgi:hypothetical protein
LERVPDKSGLYQEAPGARRLRPSARGQRYVKLRYHQDRIGVSGNWTQTIVSGNWNIKKIIEKVGRNRAQPHQLPLVRNQIFCKKIIINDFQ